MPVALPCALVLLQPSVSCFFPPALHCETSRHVCLLLQSGAMAALNCGAADAQSLIAEAGVASEVWMANQNTPVQTVVSGTPAGINALLTTAQQRPGLKATRLAVSGAFHTPLQAGASAKLQEYLKASAPTLPAGCPLVSTLSGQQLPPGTDLAAHLGKQLASEVDFVAASSTLRSLADVFVEVGPKQVLSGEEQLGGAAP